ncbi:hypothetical protein [Bacillus sp. mrc49]|uniref:hypothetical protein n=1 Tax=Bacillus sp. mrc49 TaxID=2054913 RepID=UPI000C27FD1A|nr:hypothetical protein [Bacillus sp. mrc49]PJN91478.1 hypothetical protein CVN76_04755 [Bacillus sp. mrc49]
MLLSGRIDKYAKYSQFKTLKEFNTTIEMFLLDHKEDFTKSELIAFKRLVRFSAKYRGVANAKIGTLLKAINEKANGFGVSRSTFERMLRKAKALHILTIKHTIKPKGGFGHNVFVFNKIDVVIQLQKKESEVTETPTESKVEEPVSKEEALSLLEAGNQKQENNNNKSINKIFTYVFNRVNDAIKKGTTVKYISSYVDRVFRDLETKALVAANAQRARERKQREAAARTYFEPAKKVVPFYNWLEN